MISYWRSSTYFLTFIIILLVKLIFLIYFSVESHEIFGGGNDSNYYEAYTLGKYDVAVNLWPLILRYLNEIGMYSRTGVTVFLMIIGIGLLPFLIAKLSIERKHLLRKRIYWFSVVVISAYPTLFYYTLDIYRDVFMMLVFIIGLLAVKRFEGIQIGLEKILLILCVLAIAYILYLLRPYMGFGFIISIALYKFYSFKRYPLMLSICVYLVFLNVLFMQGWFDEIFLYRSAFFNELTGGSNLGIAFDSEITFIPEFITNFVFQMFGMFFVNASTVFVFFIESVPFIFSLIYLIRNRIYSNGFVDYLVVFFIVYSTIWLLGNDNLGTAVRLRMFSYIPVFIACLMVYQTKIVFLNKSR